MYETGNNINDDQAGLVYEHILGENKFTYVEKCANPQSVTILMKGNEKKLFDRKQI